MDGLGRVGSSCQPWGKLRVSLPLAPSPGATHSTQPGRDPSKALNRNNQHTCAHRASAASTLAAKAAATGLVWGLRDSSLKDKALALQTTDLFPSPV